MEVPIPSGHSFERSLAHSPVSEKGEALVSTFSAHTLNDFCERYGIGRTKAYEEIKAGRLKARKNGRYTLITEEAAQAWLASLPRLVTSAAA